MRVVGLVGVLLILACPGLASAMVPGLGVGFGVGFGVGGDELGAVHTAQPHPRSHGGFEADACGEDEEFEELIDCGADLVAELDEPYAITVLRKTEVRTTREQCEELLADIWARQTCTAGGRECGKLLPGAMPSPGPKLATGSSSGQTFASFADLDDADVRRLGFAAESRMPKSRDLLPPVPPPKLAAR
jgi:hypothetical protein